MTDITKLSSLFKDDTGNPITLTETQKKIFSVILNREPKRNIVITPTQYGKSLTCALGIIIRAIVKKEKWCIIGATEKKAKIIMNYIIQHIFDSPIFYSQLTVNTSLERLKQERSKNRLTFRNGGEIFILSAQAKSKQAVLDSLTGFGSPNIILDDSVLIDDDLYAMVKRMLGGYKDNFLLETGNPFKRNHFYKCFKSPVYNKIRITWREAVAEGRYTQEFIDEMRNEIFFKPLYECEFPEETEVDEEGWSGLISSEELEKHFIQGCEIEGVKYLGVDVAKGGNYNAFVIRNDKVAKVKYKDKCPDLMSVCGKIIEIIKEENIRPENVFVDAVGMGSGVVDRLREQKVFVTAVNESEKASNNKYANKRAEMYFNLKMWLENGGKLCINEDFYQIVDNRYKIDSTGKIKLMSKEELRSRGIESPDIADALALTFSKTNYSSKEVIKDFLSNLNIQPQIYYPFIENKFTMKNYGG